jgi:DsbC/DsbD-like thiol-disulfide interchange protein
VKIAEGGGRITKGHNAEPGEHGVYPIVSIDLEDGLFVRLLKWPENEPLGFDQGQRPST